MQQIKSILIGWIESSRLCLSFNKVSWELLHISRVYPNKFLYWKAPSFKNEEEMLKLIDWSVKTFKDPVTNDDYEDTSSAFFLPYT